MKNLIKSNSIQKWIQPKKSRKIIRFIRYVIHLHNVSANEKERKTIKLKIHLTVQIGNPYRLEIWQINGQIDMILKEELENILECLFKCDKGVSYPFVSKLAHTHTHIEALKRIENCNPINFGFEVSFSFLLISFFLLLD